jgi:hypothetical protein
MYPSLRISWLALIGVGVVIAATMSAQRGTTSPSTSTGGQTEVTASIVRSAQALLATLDDASRTRIQFSFDSPQKTNWSNLPGPMFRRNGLRLADLTPTQRAAVMTLLSIALSRDGYQKVGDIMRGDEVLRKTEASGEGRVRSIGAAALRISDVPVGPGAGGECQGAVQHSARTSTTWRLLARPR